MVTIQFSEIPACPCGTIFPSHEEASYALTSIAGIMPQSWDSFKFSVSADGFTTAMTELRLGAVVDTAEIIESWTTYLVERAERRRNAAAGRRQRRQMNRPR
jgi:hypothetical protein